MIERKTLHVLHGKFQKFNVCRVCHFLFKNVFKGAGAERGGPKSILILLLFLIHKLKSGLFPEKKSSEISYLSLCVKWTNVLSYFVVHA